MSENVTWIRLAACAALAISCVSCSDQPRSKTSAHTDTGKPVEAESEVTLNKAAATSEGSASSQTVAMESTSNNVSPATEAAKDGMSHALLVGCTDYDYLDESTWLRGPINDVRMMQDLLKNHFNFAQENIRCLTEGQSAIDRPTKANIVRELNRLVETARPGSRVVLLLSGHGSQQPDNDPENEEDPEPDGLDEIFCPADLKQPEDFAEPYMLNALTDDELRMAIGEIRNQGAFVWVIVDACHSGSAVRGTEVYRQLPASRFFPPQLLTQAKGRASSNTRSIQADHTSFDTTTDEGGLVAIYAAQAHEPTLEMMLPEESDDSQWRGLLTYTLAKVLTSAQTPLSYNELVQRVHGEYIYAFGRLGPTPLVEGVDQNLEVLGQTELPSNSRVSLSINELGQYIATAGELHGFSAGTVFQVFPPPGEERTQTPLGYVQITHSQLLRSTVVPVEREGQLATADFPVGAQLEVAELRPGRLSLHVAFEDQSASDSNSDRAGSIRKALQTLESQPGKRIEFTEELEKADWLVRLTPDDELYLLPAEGWTTHEEQTHFGPGPESATPEGATPEGATQDNAVVDWLSERLGRIARVRGLLKLCEASQRQATGGLFGLLLGKKPCQVTLRMLSISSETGQPSKIDWTERNWTLNDGEQAILQITNTGSESVDFSVLFVDSQFGITPLFPAFGVIADNRLQPGQEYSLGPLQVETSTLGLEHLVVIATKAEGQTADFSWLGQESLEAAEFGTRAAISQNPLSAMFRDVLYSNQKVRGLRMADAESTCLRAISWKTVK